MTPLVPRPANHRLGHEDALACLDLVHHCLQVRNLPDLEGRLEAFADLIGAEHAACLLSGDLSLLSEPEREGDAPGAAPPLRFVPGTFPEAWLQLYQRKALFRVDPIVRENFRCFSLQEWAETYRKDPPPRTFLVLAESHGLRKGFSFGQPLREGEGGSLFSFSGRDLLLTPRMVEIATRVLPHLHRALEDLGLPPSPPRVSLTPREREVLQWIAAGKSSWETAKILNLQERTIHFHMGNIMKKLDTVNRSQSVALALKLGLIEVAS